MPRRNANDDNLERRIDLSEDTPNHEVRLALAKMHVALMRLARERWPTSDFVDLFIVSAVVQGTLEGRPMNAKTIALHTGLPHNTTARRLNALVKMGFVARKDRWLFVANQVPPISHKLVASLIAILEPAVDALKVHDGQSEIKQRGRA